MRHALLLALALALSGCAIGADDAPIADASPAPADGPDNLFHRLFPCEPLLNQYLIPWAETGIPEGTCVKILCAEEVPEGNLRLMVCHKEGGGGESYWEVP